MRLATIVMVLLVSGGACLADEVAGTVMRIQDRLNERDMVALLGAVDYEFVLTDGSDRSAILLEDVPVVAAPDTVAAGKPAGKPAEISPGQASARPTKVVRLDTVRRADGTIEIAEVRAPLDQPENYGGEVPRVSGLTRERLPADLRATAPAAWKTILEVNAREGQFLGVRPVSGNQRVKDERLSIAEERLTDSQRRVLWWKTRKMLAAWPPGSVLVLSVRGATQDGDTGTAGIDWHFQRPGESIHKPEILAAGRLDLDLVERPSGFKMRQVEHLVAKLRSGLAAAAVVGTVPNR